MPEFIPGLRLSELFYHEALKPILQAAFPTLRHSAALIGPGSEVLGFDTPMSTDHHWGPRLLLFVSAEDHERVQVTLHETLAHKLPHIFHGYSTNFTLPNPDDNGTQLLEAIDSGPVNHRVVILTIEQFFENALAVNPHTEIEATDWLTFPSQHLRAITSGGVFYDDLGLNSIRAKFSYYPHDVWLYLLAAGWARIGQEEHFVGRTGYVGDELGSQVIAARLVRDLMRLCFLMERQYAPYPKWFGSAFAQLQCAAQLTPIFRWVILAQSWREREQSLSQAYEAIAAMHNALGVTPPLPAKVSPFWGRPFKVIHGEQFTTAIKAAISDEAVKRIPTDIGSVDQFSDSTDLLENIALRQRLKPLYEGNGA